ncbi:hypothetical protein [Photobacterium alginatilyticum]|uniref:Uncharacterized protein n=1 Tax=Photobacterium alginatilyticum TaxID=1775171 RepID=A0ABW9YQS3_9GAMM|nr:hypothetical protein [Photobacterium alginatilyticum]NBI56206.1 hypothetical protein [Photobacterium alginatilyticum]
MSEANNFLSTARDCSLWLHKANALFTSGECLYKQSGELLIELGEVADTHDGHNDRLQCSLDLMMSAKLLYGYALETLLKGILLQIKPERVEFDIKADGIGNVLEAKITQIGVPMSKGHDLGVLAKEVGLLERLSDPKQAKQTLQHLTECVQWRSRYPAPQDSKKNRALTSQQMTDYMLFKFRDFYMPIYNEALNILDESID